MEYITLSEAKRVMSIGYSGELSTLDVEQGHVLINTWASLIAEMTPYNGEFLYYVKHVGLFKAIKESKAELDMLRSGSPTGKGVFHAICLYLKGDVQLITIVLGFPVRFTLSENPSMIASTITKFINVDGEVHNYDRFGKLSDRTTRDGLPANPVPAWFLSELHAVGATILADWQSYYADTWWKIPNGATFECPRAASPARKLLSAARYGFDLDGLLTLPADALAFDDSCIVVSDGPFYNHRIRYIPFRENCSRLEVVPKNYETLRTIAVEETYRQLHLGRLGDTIMLAYERFAPKQRKLSAISPVGMVTFHDQSRNQELARHGSISGDLATIDFSHASDSISSTIAAATLPKSLYNAIMHYRANRIEVNGKRRYLNMFSTMGSRVTFPLETHIFWCIAMITRKFAKRWYGIRTRLSDYSVYGDDVIVPSSVAELFMQFAELAGFTPNPEKSFWTGNYRESCGEEYYHGVGAKGIYWPRAVVDLSTLNGLSSLLALQHRLVSNFPETARGLSELLLSRFPNLTYNEIGWDADCLWSAFPPQQEKHITLCNIDVESVKVSRIHTYVQPQAGVSVQEIAAGEALAYAYALRGYRSFADPVCEFLNHPLPLDHRVFTHTVAESLRARFEKL